MIDVKENRKVKTIRKKEGRKEEATIRNVEMWLWIIK
jgi:hypothetical protein